MADHQSETSDRPIQVLLVTQTTARDRLLNALIDHSNPMQVHYSLVTHLKGKGPIHADMAARGVPVASLDLSDGSLESVPLAVARLRRFLRRLPTPPDVIHSLLFYPCLASELVRASIRVAPPSLVVRHHNTVNHRFDRPLHVRLDGWMALHATRVAAVSDAVADTLASEGVPKGHVSVIHNGIDWNTTIRVNPAKREEWRQRFSGRRLLVAAGRMSPVKDYPTLLRTTARVVGQCPDAHLAIAGTGPELDSLRALAASLGISGSVTFLGWVNDVYDLMAAAEVFIQSSVDEACPQTIIEAAGLGIPVATTTVGGVSEVVGTALPTIPAGHDEALAERVITLLNAPTSAREQAASLAPTVRERFSASQMAAEYVATYQRLAPKASSSTSSGTQVHRSHGAISKQHRLTISVAMATYNGERFLPQQLDSLARQVRLPDELVVVDDGSTDRTVELVEAFSRTAPFPVRLSRNEARSGHPATFLRAAGASRCDLVAFCDQDDIWRSDKIQRCVAEFEKDPTVSLLVHSGRLVDKQGLRLPRRYPAYRHRRTMPPAKAPIMIKSPGFAEVARRQAIDIWDVAADPPIARFGRSWWGHDTWVAFVGAALGTVVVLPDELVFYRQHGANVVGAPSLGAMDRMSKSLSGRRKEARQYDATSRWARERIALLGELDRRLDALPGAHHGSTPLARSKLWARLASVNERRAELYAEKSGGPGSASMLLHNALRGDYCPRARGGLGFSSLTRDLLHLSRLLDVAARWIKPPAGIAR